MTSLRRAATAIAILALLTASPLLTASASQAQSAYSSDVPTSRNADATTPAVWHRTVGKQIGVLLDSPHHSVREAGLRLAIELSARPSPPLHLRPAVKPLLAFYRVTEDRNHRWMAVTALIRLNESRSILALLTDGLTEPDLNIRRSILTGAHASPVVHRDITYAQAFNRLLLYDRTERERLDKGVTAEIRPAAVQSIALDTEHRNRNCRTHGTTDQQHTASASIDSK